MKFFTMKDSNILEIKDKDVFVLNTKVTPEQSRETALKILKRIKNNPRLPEGHGLTSIALEVRKEMRNG